MSIARKQTVKKKNLFFQDRVDSYVRAHRRLRSTSQRVKDYLAASTRKSLSRVCVCVCVMLQYENRSFEQTHRLQTRLLFLLYSPRSPLTLKRHCDKKHLIIAQLRHCINFSRKKLNMRLQFLQAIIDTRSYINVIYGVVKQHTTLFVCSPNF